MEDMRAVGADLDAGAEFTKFRRLLVDVDIDAAPDKSKRRRKTANAATNDCDVTHSTPSHVPLVAEERKIYKSKNEMISPISSRFLASFSAG